MKTTKTFENATLRTVNNGYIELNYNGKTHCFNNASVVSVNNGSISIEVDWKPERGELVKVVGCNIDCYVIFNYKSTDILYTYGGINMDFASILYFKFDDDPWVYNHTIQLLPVTPEEQQAFDDFCKSKGKIWNKEKLQWEEYKWQPKKGEKYWYIDTTGEAVWTTYNTMLLDPTRLAYGNFFPTKEKATLAAEQVKELLKSL